MTILNGDDISKPCDFFVLNVKASITEANLIAFSEIEVIRVVITCSEVELKIRIVLFLKAYAILREFSNITRRGNKNCTCHCFTNT